MSKYMIDSQTLSDLGDAVRRVTFTSVLMTPQEMIDRLNALPLSGGSAITITDTLDSHGGTIRTINAVSLVGDTVSPSNLLVGATAHNAFGEPIVGTATGSGGSVNNQNKTVNPTESQQVVRPDSGYTGLGQVTVGAIPSGYIGSGVNVKNIWVRYSIDGPPQSSIGVDGDIYIILPSDA